MTAQGPSPQRSRPCDQPFAAELENIGKAVGIVPGDAVAPLGRTHRLKQGHVRLGGDIVLGSIAETAGLRLADGAVGLARVLDGERVENAPEPFGEAALAPVESGRGKRGRKQDNAEIGVLSGRKSRRLGRKPDALADARAFARDKRCGGFGARHEIGDGHAVAVAEAMHIPGLQRLEFGKASVEEGARDRVRLERRAQAPSRPSRRRDGSAASRKASTSRSEMRNRLTR